MREKICFYLGAVVLVAVFAAAVGCSKPPNDAQVASDIQAKFNADSGLHGKQLGVQAANGTVTLSGAVDNDAQRDAAAQYAASIPGVKQVVNNLTVGSAETAQTPPPAETAQAPSQPPAKPSPARRTSSSPAGSSSGNAPNQVAQAEPPAPAPTQVPPATTPAAAPAPPPPPPPPQKATIASGTAMAIRLVDSLDTETATQGQTFHATLNSPLAVDGEVAIPAGYDVEGHVVTVQSAGKFAGQSVLVLQLDRVKVGDKYYNIQTDQYSKKGSSRGKNTAEKVGGGAALGAIIGAIAGGGKGAAIGTVAGGGLGGGVQAASKSQQIKLPSETVLTFTLQAPLTVVPTTQGPNAGRQQLSPNQ